VHGIMRRTFEEGRMMGLVKVGRWDLGIGWILDVGVGCRRTLVEIL
jgi:hypothetical protein